MLPLAHVLRRPHAPLHQGYGRLSACLLAVMLLSGCAAQIRTTYQTPAIALPIALPHATAQGSAIIADRWWTQLGDARLTRLIDDALAQNNDLAAAALRVQQARLQAGLTATNQLPQFGASANINQSRTLGESGTSRSQSLSGSVNYQLDLFGKLARQTDAAQWEANATEQDRQAAALSLIGTVSSLYWQIGYLNQRIDSAQLSLNNSQKLQQLVQVQYRNGAVSGLDTAQAEQAVASQQSSLAQLEQQRVEAQNALAILFNQSPQQQAPQQMADLPNKLPPLSLPTVQAGLPADLLARRPDLRASELRLRKVLATRDATQASYYPSISLTGSLGTSSTNLSDILKNPVLALGAGVSLPFLNQAAMQRDIAIADSQYAEAIVNFRQTLYSALADVDNALSNQQQLQAQINAQQATLNAAQRSERLYRIQYDNGAVALKFVLDAQESRRQAENALAQIQLNQLNNRVTLYQALGGGF